MNISEFAKALIEYDEEMSRIGGCSDGACRIVIPIGMHTNGGCKCFMDRMKARRFFLAASKLRKALK